MLAGAVGEPVHDHPDCSGEPAHHAAAAGRPRSACPFAFADPGRVERILIRAGFGQIETDRVIEKVGGGRLDETAHMLLELGPLNSILDDIDEKTRRAIFEDIRGVLTGFESSGPVLLDAAAWLVTARAA
jgi:hypothetical protein